jgi:hypothetical protein
MLITKEVEIKVNASVVPYFRRLGYITGKNKMLVVPVEHLNKGSHSVVEVSCDICGEVNNMPYKKYLTSVYFDSKYYCRLNKCFTKKVRLGTIEKYGVENTSKLKSFQDKWKKTNLERYGVENTFQSEEAKIKIREKGGWLNDDDLVGYIKYSRIVRRLTLRNRKNMLENWNGFDFYDGEYIRDNFNIDFNDPKYPCIDHKISIRNGYLDGISEEFLSSIDNLCFTKRFINSKKKTQNHKDFIYQQEIN